MRRERHRRRQPWETAAFALVPTLAVLSCAAPRSFDEERTMVVTATAYNSLPSQAQGDPSLGAWGDTLEPGMKVIAVSRDLLALGLTRGVRVSIEGLPDDYRVLDRMPAHWEKKIDIYMGVDLEAALAWGRREVRIRWRPNQAAR
jgi:3D (Asp-Asp-Asp) domain-containing protein